MDYLANPVIVKKNSIVLERITQYIKQLEQNTQWLEKIQNKIDIHIAECYNLANFNSSANENVSKSDSIFAHFNKELSVIEH